MSDASARKRAIAAIHVARQQLGLDDDLYRELLLRVSARHGTPCRSSADMDANQRRAVLTEMRRLGAARTYPRRPHNADSSAMPLMITKIEALLTDMKLPWAYADAIAKRQYGVERVAWVRKPKALRAIIAALHVEQDKRQLIAAVDARLKALGWDDAELARHVQLSPHWRRQRSTLRGLLSWLPEREAS